MDHEIGQLYHIYNRGNNQGLIFFTDENYKYFIRKIIKYIKPSVDILSFCLMPNHFHLLIHIPENYVHSKFSNQLRTCLTSYTRAINIQEKRTGSLFQQHTKSKQLELENGNSDLAFICFNYIHQNPLKAKLVIKMENWLYSSFHHFLNNDSSVVNIKLAQDLINLPDDRNLFYKETYESIEEELFNELF